MLAIQNRVESAKYTDDAMVDVETKIVVPPQIQTPGQVLDNDPMSPMFLLDSGQDHNDKTTLKQNPLEFALLMYRKLSVRLN